VADIGCDHGYLGIHLLLNNIASAVIAADVNQQPLDSAYRNAHKFGVQDKMSFYLSNGAVSIPRDFDTMVCAGMGADTMISILTAAPWLKSDQYKLILQCQSKTPMLRKFLSEQGWHIARETVLRDGRFLYTVMEVTWQPDAPRLTPGQQYFSPALLADTSEKVPEYYQQVLFRLNRAVTGQGDQADPGMVAALQELQTLSLKEETQ
jgi:tRNA (adenine22-N1)-methyltransferase